MRSSRKMRRIRNVAEPKPSWIGQLPAIGWHLWRLAFPSRRMGAGRGGSGVEQVRERPTGAVVTGALPHLNVPSGAAGAASGAEMGQISMATRDELVVALAGV